MAALDTRDTHRLWLFNERQRVRAAALAAKRLYPGAVGEMLSRELTAWEEFGHYLGRDKLVMRVVNELLKGKG